MTDNGLPTTTIDSFIATFKGMRNKLQIMIFNGHLFAKRFSHIIVYDIIWFLLYFTASESAIAYKIFYQ
jgi:hypothetical protein